VRIERATRADLGEVLRLVELLLDELHEDDEFAGLDRRRTLDDLQREGDRFVALIARGEGGEAAGVLTLTETFAIYAGGRYGVIDELYVAPPRRSAGVGRLLLDAAAEIGRERGWRRIDVTAPPGDRWRRTVAFYERNGFVFTGPKLRRALADGI
jgi:GNAT superfamily N-acetyltransferase